MHILTNGSAVSPLPQDFDLSRNELLHTLQISARYMSSNGSLDATSNFLRHTLSSITYPRYFQIVVIYSWSDFFDAKSREHPDQLPLREVSRAERAKEISRHRRLLKVFRKAHKVRNFQLMLCAMVWDPVGEYSVGILKEAVAEETASGGFDGFSSEPFVTYSPQRSRS